MCFENGAIGMRKPYEYTIITVVFHGFANHILFEMVKPENKIGIILNNIVIFSRFSCIYSRTLELW